MTILKFMSGDHRHCDELFVAAEQLTAEEAWPEARRQFEAFHQAMEHHFALEEELLFPAFEEATGSPMGPTQVMRYEHRQMRDLFAAMARAVQGGDREGFLGEAETLLILMQQHNAKEEQILYPMTDQTLGGRRAGLLAEMEARPR